MADEDDNTDAQDLAETFDETHREGEDPNLFDADDERDPDLDSRAYDVTHARGDAAEDDDDAPLIDEGDDDEVVRIPPEKVQAFDLIADRQADDDRLDEGLEESFPASDSPAARRPI